MSGKMRSDSGSVLMEFILVMPILLLLIFGMVQFSLIWMARLLTQYAAFSAARTAIVFHPDDWGGSNSGPVHRAACLALACMGMDYQGGKIELPGWGVVDGSGDIEKKVRVECEKLPEMQAVRATVTYDFPLLIPYAGSIISFMSQGGQGGWEMYGYRPGDGHPPFLGHAHTITLTQSWVMPYLWDNGMFPRADDELSGGAGQ